MADMNDMSIAEKALDNKLEAGIKAGQNGSASSHIVQTLPMFSAEDYFTKGQWDADQKEFQSLTPVYLGYPEFDREQPLYVGMYVFMAGSGIGKTTFLGSAADNMAAAGNHVLFFSFEQTAHEMYAKSLARYINRRYHQNSDPSLYQYDRFTAMSIRRGHADGKTELNEQMDAYVKDVSNRLSIVSCTLDTTVEDILDSVDTYMHVHNVRPVVIIDYLQIIQATEVNGRILPDERLNLDHIVKSLKQYQKDNKLVMILISSVNRENYLQVTDMSSMKSSSLIEFSADFVAGLNMAVMLDEGFETKSSGRGKKDTTTNDKRLMLGDAKGADERDVVLRVVKNRYGKANMMFFFEYEPAYDTFTSVNMLTSIAHQNAAKNNSASDSSTATKDSKDDAGSDVSTVFSDKDERSSGNFSLKKQSVENADVNDFMIKCLSKKAEKKDED